MAIQKTETNLPNLKINRLTKKMYDDALIAGTLNPNELYLTDEDIIPTGQEMDKNIYDPINVQKNIFASIPGYNILDNSFLVSPINQRGSGSYTSTANSSNYSIDRWCVFNGSTLTVGSNGACALENGLMYQLISGYNLDAIYTFTVRTWSGTVSVTGIPSKGATSSNGTVEVTITKTGSYIQVIINSKSVWIESAKLEKGTFATDYTPKGYGTELNECRRYYQRVFFAMRMSNNTVGITFNPPMRVAPTLSFISYAADKTPTPLSVGIYGGWLSIPTEVNYYTGHVIASADL